MPMRSGTVITLMKLQVWLLTYLLCVPVTSFSQTESNKEDAPGPVQILVSVAKDEITIGDHVRYTITVSAETEADVSAPLLHDRVGDFDIIDFGQEPERVQANRTTITQWYTLTIFTTGYHMIPAPKVSYTTADGTEHQAEGEAIRIHVASLLTQEGQPTDIRDVKPPEDVPFNWQPYLIGGAISFALIGLGLALYYFLKRFRREAIVPPRPAHEVALESLSQLQAKQLPHAGQFEAYYVALSAIVRIYLEDGLNIRAPEMTTEEFLSAVTRDTRLTPDQQRLLGQFLSQADLVKFARHVPSLDDSDAAYEAARRFVDETRPRPSETRGDKQDQPQEDQYAAA